MFLYLGHSKNLICVYFTYLLSYSELCGTVQEILDHDSSNYNALVFEGFAREGLHQPVLALAVYRKASSLEPNESLAWQACVTRRLDI